METRSKRAEFRRLHESGCFVIPNPWDVGSGIALQKLGFKALATSSAGLAFAHGRPDDGSLDREIVLRHCHELSQAVSIPVAADFMDGYGDTADAVFESSRLMIQTGVAGFSIEDLDSRKKTLFDIAEATDRLLAAKQAIETSGQDVLLTARAECYLVGHPDPLNESIKRLQAYAEAGADVLFAPGLKTREEIKAVVEAVSPKPVNMIMSSNFGFSVADLAEMGVRRISIGSALARAAWTSFLNAAKQIQSAGTFEAFEGLTTHGELNQFFGS